MVQLVTLLTLSSYNDVGISPGPVVLRFLSPEYIYIEWYHDTQYPNDEYGCTSLPNIFHHWLMKREDLEAGKDTHINLLGSECTDFLGSFPTVSIRRKALIIGGYRYTGPNMGPPKVVIVDISNPESPSVIKELELSTSASDYPPARVLYSEKHDLILIGYSFPSVKLHYGTWDEVINASHIDDLPSIDGYSDPWPIDGDKCIVRGSAGTAVFDFTTKTATPLTLPGAHPKFLRTPSYLVIVYETDTNTIGVQFRDVSDLSLVGDIDTGKSYPSDDDLLLEVPVGDKVVIIDSDRKVMFSVDVNGNIGDEVSIPDVCAWGDRSNDGTILCTDVGYGPGGRIKKLVGDTYYSVTLSNGKACIKDNAGNPVPNKQVFVAVVGTGRNSIRKGLGYDGLDNVTVRTTGSDGCVNISDLAGNPVDIIVGE